MNVSGKIIWKERNKLFPDDGQPNDGFGVSVALDGDTALVGIDGYLFDLEKDPTTRLECPCAKFTVPENEELTGELAAFYTGGDDLGFTVSLIPSHGQIGITQYGSFTYRPDAHFVGNDSFDYKVMYNNDANSSMLCTVDILVERNIVQIAKLLTEDTQENDAFSFSIALKGDTALVGAYLNDENGKDSGAAYVFERDDFGTWTESTMLLAQDRQAGDRFGYSVALDGNTVLIGAYFDDDNGYVSGSAYIFERDGQGPWIETAKLLARDGEENDWFGASVALDGDTALIGADYKGRNASRTGSAYIFERDGTGSWLETARVFPKNGNLFDGFGSSVALDGDIAIVGAPWDDDNGFKSGSVYIFEHDAIGNWVETAKLIPQDGPFGDEFGVSVSLDKGTVLIGAFRDDDNGLESGSAYVFERNGSGTWTETAKLLASDGQAGNLFGNSVALDGDTALIGAHEDFDKGISSGSAYIFERDGSGNWRETAKFLSLDGQENDRFGRSVALDGRTALVGADGHDIKGSAYLFDIPQILNGTSDIFATFWKPLDDFTSPQIDPSRWDIDKSPTANSPLIESGRLVFDNERHANDRDSASTLVHVLQDARGISADLIISPESTFGSDIYSQGGIEIGAENDSMSLYFSLKYDMEEGQNSIGFQWNVSDETSAGDDPNELWEGYDPTGFQIGQSYNLALMIDLDYRLRLFVDGRLFQTSPSIPLLKSVSGFYIASWTNNGRIRGYADNVEILVKTDRAPGVQIPLKFYKGWNLFSVPIAPAEFDKKSFFEGKFMGDIWKFNDGRYQQSEVIEPGRAYWVYLTEGLSVIYHCPEEPSAILLPTYNKGWNLYSPQSPIFTPAEEAGTIWRYSNCRFHAVPKNSILQPGLGYWINLPEFTSLTLGSLKIDTDDDGIPNYWDWITTTDRILMWTLIMMV